jgi:hypothetical protein
MMLEGFRMNSKVDIVQLTSAEISSLWATHLNVNVVICFMTHYLETCSDPEILALLEEAIQLAKKHSNDIEQLFIKEKIVVPESYRAEKHVVPNAPKLFSDLFYIQTLHQMIKFGLATHTASFTLSARVDVRHLYNVLVDDVADLYNRVVECMQEKGIYMRMPFMNYPTKVDFIKKENFMTGLFGRRRTLLGGEVTHLTMNATQNELGKALCTGFSQVITDHEIRAYIHRGKQLCNQIVSSINQVLEESDIPTSVSWEQSVSDSTTAPFSDQFMLFIVGILSNLGITAYAAGLSSTMRRDISAMYANFIAKTGAYAEDGLELMIERNWMEQPPQMKS